MNACKLAERLARLLGISISSLRAYSNRKKARADRSRWKLRPGLRKGSLQYRIATSAESAENELYRKWRDASDAEKPDFEEQLFRRVQTHASAVVWERMGENPRHLAHDIASAAIEMLPTFRGESRFSTWAQGIANNKINQELRTRIRSRNVIDDKANHEEELRKRSSSDALGGLNERLLLDDLTKGLEPEENALLGYMVESRSTAEIAEALHITPEAAESRRRRLRSKLRKKILRAA